MGTSLKDKTRRLFTDGTPNKLRCYDLGPNSSYDRYVVVFGHKRTDSGEFMHVSMSDNPKHPLGVYIHEFTEESIDDEECEHLGKQITFFELPVDCQDLIMEDYFKLWNLKKS
jgi:hypothetical protein